MDLKLQIQSGLNELKIDFIDEQVDLLETYKNQLLKWNKVFNLTSITDEKDVITKHFMDSLSVNHEIQGTQQVLDVGTGAGFQGMVVAIFNPGITFHLVDGVAKKISFLDDLKGKLGLTNVNTYHEKVENLRLDTPVDIVISRAFADIKKMMDLTQHLLKTTGQFFAMKGPGYEMELESLDQNKLAVVPLKIPFYDGSRSLVKIYK